MAKIVCYVGKLKERNGEYEYTHTIRFKTSGDPFKFLDRVAKNFYEAERTKDSEGYYFNGGEVYVSPHPFPMVISPELFEKLEGIVTQH